MFPMKVENDIVIITSETGQVKHVDVIDTLSFIADNSSSYQSKKLLIIDSGSEYDPSREELQQFIGLIKLLLEKTFSRIALVVSKIVHYGLGRIAESFTDLEKGHFSVFTDEQKARDWLSTS